MSKKLDNRYDVIIIGAGPAGLCFARLLAETGLRIALIERLSAEVLADPPVDGRDIALTHFSAELLEEIDVWNRFPAGSVSTIKEARVVNGRSPYFLHFDHRDTKKQALGYIVSNHLIRKAAYDALEQFPNVRLMAGTEATSFETASCGASVHLSGGQTLESTLVIAADSRFSMARRKMGISTSMKDFGRVVIVCQMDHETTHQGIAYECFHFDQTLAVLPLVGNRSSVVITLPTDQSEAVLNMDEGAFNADIESRFDHRLGKMKLVGKRYPYDLVATHADQFVANRFALIGDAAVGMHPVTAHGFNLGLRSAHTLALEVRSALRRGIDIAAPSVLKRYESKHRRITLPLYLGTNALVRLYTAEGAGARIARSLMLRLANHLSPVKRAIMNQLTNVGSLWRT